MSYPSAPSNMLLNCDSTARVKLHGFPGQRRSRTDYLGNDFRWVRRNRLSNASQAPNFGHSDSGVTFAFDPLQTLAVGLPKALSGETRVLMDGGFFIGWVVEIALISLAGWT